MKRRLAAHRDLRCFLCNLLFRWFVELEIDEEVWNHAVFSKNRDRLLNQDSAEKFFAQVKEQAAGLMSDEHFTVDGTLIEAWAGKSIIIPVVDVVAGLGTQPYTNANEEVIINQQ